MTLPKTCSLIVPVYNEQMQLERLIHHLMEKSSTFPIPCEWIFVDDCSTDESYSILLSLQLRYGYRVIRQDRNKGKGAAIIRGIQETSGEFVVIQDADFEYDPMDIPALLEPLLTDRADVVYGSRFKMATQVHRTYHYYINKFLTTLSNLFSGIYLSDMETCYKVFRADLLKAMRLRSYRFGIEVELTAYTAKVRARIVELPISYYPRTRLEGKKINWKDGVAALWHLIRFNWLTSVHEAYGLPKNLSGQEGESGASITLPSRYLFDIYRREWRDRKPVIPEVNLPGHRPLEDS